MNELDRFQAQVERADAQFDKAERWGSPGIWLVAGFLAVLGSVIGAFVTLWGFVFFLPILVVVGMSRYYINQTEKQVRVAHDCLHELERSLGEQEDQTPG